MVAIIALTYIVFHDFHDNFITIIIVMRLHFLYTVGLTTLLTTILFTLFGIITVVAIFCCIAAAILIKTRKCGKRLLLVSLASRDFAIKNNNIINKYYTTDHAVISN